MTKLAEIQAAILQLGPKEQERLRIWLGSTVLDLEEDGPELEVEMLKAVRGGHSTYSSNEMRAICEQVLQIQHQRQIG